LEAKRTRKYTILGLIVLEIIIVRLNVIAELEQVVRGRAYKMNNTLLLKSKKDIEERKGTLLFSLYFLLATRVKVTSSASSILTVTSASEEDIGTRSRL